MIKLVAFDWNGTLLADTLASLFAENMTLKDVGAERSITLREYQNAFAIPISKYFYDLGFSKIFFAKNADALFKGFYKHYEPLEIKCRTRSGVKELLRWCQHSNVSAIIYSNHFIPHIEKQIERLKINGLITKILARSLHDNSHLHNRGKIDWLKKYIKKQKLKPKEVISVGDTCEEIEIGQSLGLHTVAVTGGYNSAKRLKACKPDFLIHNLKDLIPIIKKLNSQ
jgi:phosphoglycolate phosphatase